VKRSLLLILIVAGIAFSAGAQAMNTSVNTRAKFKSLFMYKFAQSTEWPEAYKKGDFVIAVVNDDDLAKELEAAAKNKSINSQTVVVKSHKTSDEVGKCHILYISGKSTSEVEPYFNKAKQYSTLIITEAPGLLEKYSAINFIGAGNLIRYEMNRKLFKDQGLVVSNALENLATKVVN
jgi:hypothetical protein